MFSSVVGGAPTCCENNPAAVDSEVRWRCEPAVSASVCREASRCGRVVPGATRPPPPGRQAALLAPSLLEPPVGLGGRLGREGQTPVLYYYTCIIH